MLVDGQATTSILIEFGNLKNIMNTIDLIQQFPIYSNNPEKNVQGLSTLH
jgi:hypothetical protein